MSREYSNYPPPRGGGDRWDADRFEHEERSHRFSEPRFEDRGGRGGGRSSDFGPLPSRMREHSDEDFNRRGPPRFDDRGPGGGGSRFEEDRYEKKVYYDDEPRYQREEPFGRARGGSTNITIEKEREYYRRSPSPPRRTPMARPGFLRRQSSLDTFDRKPLTRFQGRDEYGPPARYREDARLPPMTPIPLPKTRQLGPPPRRYEERDYEEIRVAEPDFYGDDEFRGYPERVREREIIRTRRRSKERRRSRSRESLADSRITRSVRSGSSSSRETSISMATATRNEFPKKGKTRMPARLVSKQAIKDLGYPYEEEGDVIIIQKALGRENIDEVIKLSEDYKNQEHPPITETTLTTYVVDPDSTPAIHIPPPMSEHGGTIFEEHKTKEVFTVPPPQSVYHDHHHHAPPAQNYEVITDTKITTRSPSPPHHHHHDHHNAVIIDAGLPPSSSPVPVGPLALVTRPHSHSRDERSIRDEIRALEAEKEALRAERRADREFRKADRIRHGARHSDGDLVLYEEDRRVYDHRDDVVVVKKEYIEESGGGVKILKDKKGPPPKLLKAMLKTLT